AVCPSVRVSHEPFDPPGVQRPRSLGRSSPWILAPAPLLESPTPTLSPGAWRRPSLCRRHKPVPGGPGRPLAVVVPVHGGGRQESRFCLADGGHQRLKLEGSPTQRHTRSRPSLRELFQAPQNGELARFPRTGGRVESREPASPFLPRARF